MNLEGDIWSKHPVEPQRSNHHKDDHQIPDDDIKSYSRSSGSRIFKDLLNIGSKLARLFEVVEQFILLDIAFVKPI